jgi:catechol 2,3-dioxygenase-like lactoylglutathione lyase family enzyme
MKNPLRNNLVIELHVPDLDAAKDFYSKLGFEAGLYDKPNGKGPGYLTMFRKDGAGETMLNFYGGDERVYGQAFFRQFPKDTKRGYAVSVTIPTGEIEEIYRRAVKLSGGNIVRELKELEDRGKKWKDFRMVDPFGFYIRFTEIVDWGQQ